MLGDSLFKPKFSKDLPLVRELLQKAIRENWRVFKFAGELVNKLHDLQLFCREEIAILFLVANLVVVSSGHLLVLEDTDPLDSSLLFTIRMELKRHA
jgi:hypothetical protein